MANSMAYVTFLGSQPFFEKRADGVPCGKAVQQEKVILIYALYSSS